jgi:hypothetical protein
MNDKHPLPENPQWSDDHIDARVVEFRARTGEADIAITEKHERVGFYYITVSFVSNDTTRIDYDGANPNRNVRPVVTTSHRNDEVRAISAVRVRDGEGKLLM